VITKKLLYISLDMLLKYSFTKTNMYVLFLRLLICDFFRQNNHQLIAEEFVIISLIILR